MLFVAVACTLFMGAVKKRNLKMQGNGVAFYQECALVGNSKMGRFKKPVVYPVCGSSGAKEACENAM